MQLKKSTLQKTMADIQIGPGYIGSSLNIYKLYGIFYSKLAWPG